MLLHSLLPCCGTLQVATRTWQPSTVAGRAACARCLTVTNHVGGVQRSDQPYTEPRYTRSPVSKQKVLEELHRGTSLLAAAANAIKHADGMCPASIDKPVTLTSSSKASADQAPCGDSDSSSNSNSSCTDGHTSVISSAGPVAPISSSALGSDAPGCNDVHKLCSSGENPLHSWSRQLTVDVLVPTARLDLDLLEGIAQAVL